MANSTKLLPRKPPKRKNKKTVRAKATPVALKPVLTKRARVLLLLAVVLTLVYIPLLKAMPSFRLPKPTPIERSKQLAYLPVGQLTNTELAHELGDKRSETPRQHAKPSIGLYEKTKIIGASGPYLRQVFIGLQDSRGLSEELLKTKRLQAVPLITVEPSDHHSPRLITGPQDMIAGRKLLDDITKGKYDGELNRMLSVLHNYHAPVYVRFAHEMDLAYTYPWGDQDPAAYIAAYRHVVLTAKKQHVSNVKWLWTPSGNTDALPYYPGDDVVDVVGVTVIYAPDWIDGQPSFWELTSRQRELSRYHKPLWIVEFGIDNADRSYQTTLLKDAVAHYKADGFAALVYINTRETNPKYGHLDYRLIDLHSFSQIF